MGFLMFDTFDGCSGAALATPAAVGSHTTFARRPSVTPLSAYHKDYPLWITSGHYTTLYDKSVSFRHSYRRRNIIWTNKYGVVAHRLHNMPPADVDRWAEKLRSRVRSFAVIRQYR